jgi:hypothetical protein
MAYATSQGEHMGTHASGRAASHAMQYGVQRRQNVIALRILLKTGKTWHHLTLPSPFDKRGD